jgi:hypothetical protein
VRKKKFGREKVKFSILFIADNVPGHPGFLCYKNEIVEIIFLPPNSISFLQPLD